MQGLPRSSKDENLVWGRSPQSLTQQLCDLYNPVALRKGCDEVRKAYDYRQRKKLRKVLATLTGSTQVHQTSGQRLGVVTTWTVAFC